MPKTSLNITDRVMDRIDSGRVAMKPAWYFAAGSVVLISGLAALTVMFVFVFMLISFSLRTHGPMGEYRWDQLVAGFPWWAIPVALGGIVAGVWLLKKYDFSYRHNFLLVISGLLFALVLAGVIADRLDLISRLPAPDPVRRFYRQYDGGGLRYRQVNPTGQPLPADRPASTGYPRHLRQFR